MAKIDLIAEGDCFTIYTLVKGDQYDFDKAIEAIPVEGRKLVRRIRHFADNGDPHDPKKCDFLEDGLFAFKTIAKYGGVLRAIFFYVKGENNRNIVISTQTFFKNSNAMPRGQLDRAKNRRNFINNSLKERTIEVKYSGNPKPKRIPR